MSSNDQVGISEAQPTTDEGRLAVATRCSSALAITSPVLIDGIDDAVATAYAAFPDRLYLVDRQGRVAYKGGRGPVGYKPRELEQSIVMLLMDRAP